MRQKERRIFLHSPYLKWSFIRRQAEGFRSKYVKPANHLPVPIIEIVELALNISPYPIIGLMERIDIDGFLTRDLKNICIDQDIYMDERREKRLRFTYAHEVGHLILHENEIRKCDFRTPDMWIHFHEDFLAEDLNWFEQQAREFGGRLLVPPNELTSEILSYRDKINEFKSQTDSEEDLIEALSRLVCDKFAVSSQVIQRRIRSEKIWPKIKASL